jgi:hypothetical protein
MLFVVEWEMNLGYIVVFVFSGDQKHPFSSLGVVYYEEEAPESIGLLANKIIFPH